MNRHPGRPNVLLLATLRQFHVYLAMLAAPSLIFFTATGAMQMFKLHEAHGDYTPPAVIEKLGTLHKSQRFALRPKKADAPALASAQPDKAEKRAAPKPPSLCQQALRWFWLGAAFAIILSTTLGVWMGVTLGRDKGLHLVLLLTGMAIPVLLTIFS